VHIFRRAFPYLLLPAIVTVSAANDYKLNFRKRLFAPADTRQVIMHILNGRWRLPSPALSVPLFQANMLSRSIHVKAFLRRTFDIEQMKSGK